MTDLKELYNLNRRTAAEKLACLSKQKEHIAQIDKDIAKFLGASDPVQVYIIRILVDKHRDILKNFLKKKNTTVEENYLVNQIEIDHRNNMQGIIYSEEEKVQNRKTRMEIEPPTTQLSIQESLSKRKNTSVEKDDNNNIMKKKEKKTNKQVEESEVYQNQDQIELEAPVTYLKVQESSLKRRHLEDEVELVNKKKDERHNKQAEVILNESEEELLKNLEEGKEKAIDKITLLITECGTHDSGTEESKKLMLLRYNSKIKKSLDALTASVGPGP